jgi:two-component sensor histidine kinase
LQARARVMSLVHETLYQSQNIARVNLPSYIKTLTSNVMETIGINFNTQLQVHADDISVGIDTAIPCGLIINELVTNALKYAFPPAFVTGPSAPPVCEIHIGIHLNGPSILLSVSDNGVGLPEGFDWKKARSLGLRLVNILACNQLRGTIEVGTGVGTTFTIAFCEPQSKHDKLKHTEERRP